MGWLFVALGSAAGAVLGCLVMGRAPSWSAGFALNGIVCGLLGALGALGVPSQTGGADAVDFARGLLGTAAPLTLCLVGIRAVESGDRSTLVARRFAATLAVALVSGTSCAALGFVAVESVRSISVQGNGGEPVGHPLINSLTAVFTPTRPL